MTDTTAPAAETAPAEPAETDGDPPNPELEKRHRERRQAYYDRRWPIYSEAMPAALREFDKYLITVASAAFGFTVAYGKEHLAAPGTVGLLQWSFVCLAAAALVTVVSYLVTYLVDGQCLNLG